MRLSFNAADEAFRQEVRRFLAEKLPPHLAAKERQGFHVPKVEVMPWQKTLYDRGWGAPGWPKQYGGTGWSPIQKYIYDLEYGLANAPETNTGSLKLVGPVICQYGSEELKARYLEPIIRGELIIAQGFSEPSAGSDLASLQTRAVRDGDDFIINGHKTWTSHAHAADMVLVLCRTDPQAPKPQRGLSMIIVPLDAPGVTVQAIPTIDEQQLNEVFFQDVRVPAAELIGEENKAWGYAKFLLENERTYNAHLGHLKRYLTRIPELAAEVEAEEGRPVITDAFRRTLARLEIDVEALEWSVLRVLADPDSPTNGPAASALKVRGSELLLRVSDFILEVMGPQSAAKFRPDYDATAPLPGGASASTPGLLAQYLYWRAATIFSGSNDIQREIIWNTLFR